jgi:myo-inositol-1(or 4)-monophosphatase
MVLGAVGHGVTYSGDEVHPTGRTTLDGARVLASRSEVKRGEWERYADAAFEVVPCGSVAYKLGLVAAGRADATWTLVPKNEWDVAAGAALVRAAGLVIQHADGTERGFNERDPKMPNFLAGPRGLLEEFRERWLDQE